MVSYGFEEFISGFRTISAKLSSLFIICSSEQVKIVWTSTLWVLLVPGQVSSFAPEPSRLEGKQELTDFSYQNMCC